MHPRVQKKLREELILAYDITVPRVLTFDEVQSGNSPCLDAVINEILRLGQTAPMASRQGKLHTPRPLEQMFDRVIMKQNVTPIFSTTSSPKGQKCW